MHVQREITEILLRFRGGQVAAAHVVDLEYVVDDATGEMVGAPKELPPRNIDPAEVGTFIGDAADYIAQAERATTACRMAEAECTALKAERDFLAAALEGQRERIVTQLAEREEIARKARGLEKAESETRSKKK